MRCGFDPWVKYSHWEKEMAHHSSIFAWEIPWTKEPNGLQSMGSQSLRGLETKEQQQFHCTYVPHVYPFLCRRMLGLLPRLGCCKYCCYYIPSSLSFLPLVLSLLFYLCSSYLPTPESPLIQFGFRFVNYLLAAAVTSGQRTFSVVTCTRNPFQWNSLGMWSVAHWTSLLGSLPGIWSSACLIPSGWFQDSCKTLCLLGLSKCG